MQKSPKNLWTFEETHFWLYIVFLLGWLDANFIQKIYFTIKKDGCMIPKHNVIKMVFVYVKYALMKPFIKIKISFYLVMLP